MKTSYLKGRRARIALMAVMTLIMAHSTAAPSLAATQGTLGATSTGTVNISVTKAQLARISGLTDMTLPSWQEGQGDVLLSDDVCVYSTRPSGGYTIKASGSGTSGAFALASGSSASLPYSVAWNAGGVGSLSNSGTTLSANVISGRMTNAATDSSTCNGVHPGPTARLLVSLLANALSTAPDGSYTGTLTLLVAPN